MMLRASVEQGSEIDNVRAVTEGNAADASVVPRGPLLIAFAEAVLGDDDAALEEARRALHGAVGDAAFVDAAAVVANFQRMVRIADGTGIPLDNQLELMTQDLRSELGIERFGSSANTAETGPLRRVLGRVLRPIALAGFRRRARH
jgi:hypothetical protein